MSTQTPSDAAYSHAGTPCTAIPTSTDAMAAMEELGHTFFVFVNAETERIAILYAREDGDYGLIEPVIGGEYTTGRSKATARRG